MHIPSSLRNAALGLALSPVAFAQSPAPSPPVPPADGAASMANTPASAPQAPFVTQSSRVRAFNPAPGGEVRSLYLQNGSVVDLTPALGGQLGPAVHKGDKITVTGTKSEVNGQSLVEAASVRLNDQTFSANGPSGPSTVAEGGIPPQPLAASSRRRNKGAAPAPCSTLDDGPPPDDFGGPPPPPDRMGPPPPTPAGGAPPPPPPDAMPPPPPQG
jgi:hypothetical protein